MGSVVIVAGRGGLVLLSECRDAVTPREDGWGCIVGIRRL